MEIVPPKDFKDARSIPARFNKHDPRLDSFSDAEVVVNLRECSRVRPPAILWCAVYLLLAKRRGCDCQLLAPNDVDVSSYLMDAGLSAILQQAGVNVDLNGATTSSSINIVLPLTRFDGMREAADLTNKVEESLFSSGLGSSNIHPIVCEQFSELVNNAAEHSESNIGSYGFVQFHPSRQERRFMCGVADGGIGIRQSLKRNPKHREPHSNDWTAIRKATEELVSGTFSGTRGIGLFGAFEEMRSPGRELVIHSENGILTMDKSSQIRFIRVNLFPGTLVYFSAPA